MPEQFTTQDRERLVRVEDGMTTLTAKIDTFVALASSETGFPRCAARKVRWDVVKEHQEKVDSFITWFYRGIAGATILAAVGTVWSYYSWLGKLLSAAAKINFDLP